MNYYVSPLRKDFVSKPVKIFTPVANSAQNAQIKPKNKQTQIFLDGRQINIIKKKLHHYDKEEGIFLSNSNFVMLYKRNVNSKQSYLEGTQYLITPEGILIEANYKQGKLDGWVVGLFGENILVCDQYSKGQKNGEHYFLDMKEKLFGKSLYKKGKLMKLQNSMVYSQPLSQILPSSIYKKVQELQSKQFRESNIPHIKEQKYTYYGQKKDKYPEGYGILFSDKDIYYGQFNNGLLNGLGFISYGIKSYYYGEFDNGSCGGYGLIQKLNISHQIYQYDNQKVSKQQFELFLARERKPSIQNNWLKVHNIQGITNTYNYILKVIINNNNNATTNQEQKSSVHALQISSINEKKETFMEKLQFSQNQERQKNVEEQKQHKKQSKSERVIENRKLQIQIEQSIKIPKGKQVFTYREIKNTKQYIDKEGNLSVTKSLIPKKKIFNQQSNRQTENKQFISKKGDEDEQYNTQVHYGKIIRVSSKTDEEKEDQFIQKLMH